MFLNNFPLYCEGSRGDCKIGVKSNRTMDEEEVEYVQCIVAESSEEESKRVNWLGQWSDEEERAGGRAGHGRGREEVTFVELAREYNREWEEEKRRRAWERRREEAEERALREV